MILKRPCNRGHLSEVCVRYVAVRVDLSVSSVSGAVYRYVLGERHVPADTIALSLGIPAADADEALAELRLYRLVDDSRDLAGSVRATSPVLALGRLIMLAMAGGEGARFEIVPDVRTVQEIVQHAALQAATHHLAISVDSFTTLAETAVTMARRNVTVFHARPLLGSKQAVQTIVDYAHLKGLAVTSVWSRAYVSAPEAEDLQQWIRDSGVPMVVHPSLDIRGLTIDDGRLGVVHHDRRGVSLHSNGDRVVHDTGRTLLPSRRLRVLYGLVAGASDEELAALTNVSIKTVRRDISGLRALLGAESRAGLVATARMLHLA